MILHSCFFRALEEKFPRVGKQASAGNIPLSDISTLKLEPAFEELGDGGVESGDALRLAVFVIDYDGICRQITNAERAESRKERQ